MLCREISNILSNDDETDASLAFSLLIGAKEMSVLGAITTIFRETWERRQAIIASKIEALQAYKYLDFYDIAVDPPAGILLEVSLFGIRINYSHNPLEYDPGGGVCEGLDYNCYFDDHLKYSDSAYVFYEYDYIEPQLWMIECRRHIAKSIHQYAYIIEKKLKEDGVLT